MGKKEQAQHLEGKKKRGDSPGSEEKNGSCSDVKKKKTCVARGGAITQQARKEEPTKRL